MIRVRDVGFGESQSVRKTRLRVRNVNATKLCNAVNTNTHTHEKRSHRGRTKTNPACVEKPLQTESETASLTRKTAAHPHNTLHVISLCWCCVLNARRGFFTRERAARRRRGITHFLNHPCTLFLCARLYCSHQSLSVCVCVRKFHREC